MATETDVQQWEYRVELFHNFELRSAQNRLNRLGAEGWEVVTISTTSKIVALIGNEVVFVLKRPGVGPFTSTAQEPAEQTGGW